PRLPHPRTQIAEQQPGAVLERPVLENTLDLRELLLGAGGVSQCHVIGSGPDVFGAKRRNPPLVWFWRHGRVHPRQRSPGANRITSSEKLRQPWLGDHNRGIRANQ